MAIGDGANTIRAEELALFRHKAAVLSQNKRGVKTGSVNATQEKCSSRYQGSDGTCIPFTAGPPLPSKSLLTDSNRLTKFHAARY